LRRGWIDFEYYYPLRGKALDSRGESLVLFHGVILQMDYESWSLVAVSLDVAVQGSGTLG
jgi:hypothetical protein